LEPHVLRDVALPHIYPYLNLQMLYGKHLGLRGLVSRLLEDGDPKARELHEAVEALKQQAVEWRMIVANGNYQWFRAPAAGAGITVLDAPAPHHAPLPFPPHPPRHPPCPPASL